MKTKRNILVLFIVAVCSMTNNVLAQDLSKLSTNDRNNKLIEIAKEVYKAPSLKHFYREYGTPTITEMRTATLSVAERKKIAENPKDIWYGSSNNQKFYIVVFHYDMSKERFDQAYAAKVYIWENTGKAFAIGLGNMFMFPVRDGKIPNHDKLAEPEEYYTLTFSKSISNFKSLPKKARYGEIVTIQLNHATIVAADGWTTERGIYFDANKNIENGVVLSDTKEYLGNHGSYNRYVQIKVVGNLKVDATSYSEEYEDPY